jgi:tRNA (guanine37-N1)-methyltransferase
VRVDVLTIFPGIFEGPLRESLLGKAIADGVVEVNVHDIRDHATDKHRTTDDTSFGGGPGMVMKAEPIFAAVESLPEGPKRVLLLSPAGRRLDQALVRELAGEPRLVLIAGRYEGVDERVVEALPAEEVSIGDYVLSGGEVPALVVLEAVTRLVSGVVGREESLAQDSFAESEPGLLDHPHYTRPREFRGLEVPDVLVSGHHGEVERWRREAALEKTRRNRPDLLTGETTTTEEEESMADRTAIDHWVQRYVQAWGSNDPAEIGGMFSEDAEYYTAPFREPWRGRDEIVREWLGRKDEPGTWGFRYEIVGVDGDTGFVRGWTTYTGAGDPEPGPYSNMWQIRLAADGSCSLFVEWWMDESR